MALVTADDIYQLYCPQPCGRRVYLCENRPELRAPPSEYDQLLMRFGREHEEAHLSTLPTPVRPKYPRGDLTAGAEETRRLMSQRAPVIHQGVVLSAASGMAGIPDFLVLQNDAYLLRDTKLAVNLDRHPEIPLQLSLYARAFEESVGSPPAATQVVLRDGTVTDVGVIDVGETIREVVELKEADDAMDEAVGWSKCEPCAFSEYCWREAEERHDPGVVVGVDQGLRNTLVEAGYDTYDRLLDMEAEQLAEMQRPWGTGQRRVGPKLAARILRQARVLMSGDHELFAEPEPLPDVPCVYFDIEADPHDEGLENKVYLWGLYEDLAEGREPTYWGEIVGPGDDGDREGWFRFLDRVSELVEERGWMPFVHYSHYERTWVRKYIDRWGDPEGVAGDLLEALWDLEARAVRKALCLPVPSYGLKQIEKHTGFQRSQEDYGSLWSVVRYHEWVEAATPEEKERIRDELLQYNREDCEAMRHVLGWLRRITRARRTT